MTLTIELAWPEALLWPNNRAHWSKKSPAKKSARAEGYYVAFKAKTNMVGGEVWPAGDIPVRITGHKPNSKPRDRDNFQAALKSQLDGIAEALGVNDERFRPVTDWGDVCPPRGKVTVEIEL